MKKYVKLLVTLSAFAAIVNIVNIFNNDAALGLILLGIGFAINDTSFYCGRGFHLWQHLDEEL